MDGEGRFPEALSESRILKRHKISGMPFLTLLSSLLFLVPSGKKEEVKKVLRLCFFIVRVNEINL